MTTRADIARDIMYEAYLEVVGRGLLPKSEELNLKEAIDGVLDNVEDEPLSDEQKYVVQNKHYAGYAWNNDK